MVLRLSLLGSLPLICGLVLPSAAVAAETPPLAPQAVPTTSFTLGAAALPSVPPAGTPVTTLQAVSPALKTAPMPTSAAVPPANPTVDQRLLKELQANPNPLQLPNQPAQVQIKTVQPITLKEAIELARQNNPTLQVRQLELDQARAVQREVFAQFLPTLGVTGQATYQQNGNLVTINSAGGSSFNNGEQYFSTTSQSQLTGSLNFNYTLFNFTRGATYAAAVGQVRQADLAYEKEFEDLKLRVAETYYALQNADQQARIQEEAVRASLVSLKDARALLKAGVGTQFDVLRQEVQLATDQQNLVSALAAQDKQRRALAALLNTPQNVNLLAADPVEMVAIWKPTLEESIVAAFQNRAELENLLVQREVSLNRADAARGQILPSLALQAGTGTSFTNSTNNTSGETGRQALFNNIIPSQNQNGYSYNVGLVLNWPFYDGGAAMARARQQELNAAIAEQTFTNTRNDIRRSVEEQFYDLQSSITNVGTTKVSVAQAKEALRLARLRFQAGVGTQTEVIDAQRDLTRAESQRLSAIITYNTAYARMVRQVSNYPAVTYPQ